MEKIEIVTRIFYLVVAILCILFAYEHIYRIYQLEVKLVNQKLKAAQDKLKSRLHEEVADAKSTLTLMDNIISLRVDGTVPFNDQKLLPLMAPLINNHKNQFNIYFALNESLSRKFFNEDGIVFTVHKDINLIDTDRYNDRDTFKYEVFHGARYQIDPKAIWYHVGKKSRNVEITHIYFDETLLKVWMFSLVKGIYRKNQFQGIIAVDFFLDSFLKDIAKEMNRMHGSLALIDNNTGKVYSHLGHVNFSNYKGLSVKGLISKDLDDQKVTNTNTGSKYLLNTFTIKDFNWTIVTLISQDAIYSEVFSKVKLLLVACFFLLLFNLFLGYLLFRYLNKLYFEIITQNQSRGITRLTEGLCHEINNPLATLNLCQGAIKRILRRDFDDSTVNGLMKKSERASEKIQVIIQKLQNISFTSSDLDLKPTYMGDLVEELKMIFSDELKKNNISLTLNAPEGGVVVCDPLKMLQTLMPLVENSIEEIQNQKERWIRIEVEKNKNGSSIRIVDSGPGIKKGIRERIFLPFFTTKTRELKKGLGLTVAKSFIEQQGGTITYVEGAKFTTFKMNLPITVPTPG